MLLGRFKKFIFKKQSKIPCGICTTPIVMPDIKSFTMFSLKSYLKIHKKKGNLAKK
jgi:hypothetical protein